MEEEGIKDATEIGLEFVTSQSGCTGEIEPGRVKQLEKEGKIKFKRTENCRYETREIYDMIRAGRIRIPINNIIKVSENVFQKHKTGSRYNTGKRRKEDRIET